MDKFVVRSCAGGESNSGKRPAKIYKNSNKTKRNKRSYDPNFLTYGFTWTGHDEDPRPQCVVCGEVLANESFKPCKLQRHLQTKHSELQAKPLAFFQRKQKALQGQKSVLKTATTANKRALQASFVVAHWIAKTGKAHTIGVRFFLPCAKEVVSVVLGQSAADLMGTIPLSNDTISRRIESMAEDVMCQVIAKVKQSQFFAIQIDETTDVSSDAQLLTYIRYEHEGELQEDFLFCRTLTDRATGEQLFATLDSFISDNGLDWQSCVGICSDGARAMTGKYSGLVTRVQAVAPNAVWTHCIIHRQALVAKKMPPSLKQVLDNAVSAVNAVKTSATSSRIFRVVCDEMGSEHNQLLYHTEVRWLSRGRVLSRLFELREEVRIFFADKNNPLAEKFADPKWLAQLAYLADIFDRLNVLNAGLQGRDTNLFVLTDKIESWIHKLRLWHNRVSSGDFEAFALLDDFLDEHNISKDDLKPIICEHIDGLIGQFRNYFPEKASADNWIRNPFVIDTIAVLPLTQQEGLIDISCDESLKASFTGQPLAKFWISVRSEYPELSNAALRKLVPFASTYLCESGFSALTLIKNKYRSRLRVEGDLRLFLSPTQPRIDELCSELQAHPSH